MKRKWIVKEDDARPAGNPGECFYCKGQIGDEHGEKCVKREKTVIVDVTFTILRVIPEHWDADQLNYFMKEGRFCSDQLINELENLEVEPCSCDISKAKYIREATAEDEKLYNRFISSTPKQR